MNCPVCGAHNLPNAAFCSQCATSLMVPPHLAGGAMYGMAPRTSGMAIAGFVLSFFCGLLGLIFSIIGYNECKKSNGMVTGEGLAVAGIVISIVMLLITIAVSASGRH
jgi:uncharacterized protein DUF4190/zinc ribbon protein